MKNPNDFQDVLNKLTLHLGQTEGYGPQLRNLFCDVDFLGALYAGARRDQKETSRNAVKFIREFLGRVNTIYQTHGGLIYHCFRHGLIHESRPKVIELENNQWVGFVVTFDQDSKVEIVPFDNDRWGKYLSEQERTKKKHILLIPIHTLVGDFNKAYDFFLAELDNDDRLREKVKRVLSDFWKPEKQCDLRIENSKNGAPPYRGGLKDSDFDFSPYPL